MGAAYGLPGGAGAVVGFAIKTKPKISCLPGRHWPWRHCC